MYVNHSYLASFPDSLPCGEEESGLYAAVSVWEGGELGVEALIDIRIQPISVSKQVTSSKCATFCSPLPTSPLLR